MRIIVIILIILAAAAFVLAIIGTRFMEGSPMDVAPEAYSRASTNLALLAIATLLLPRGKSSGG